MKLNKNSNSNNHNSSNTNSKSHSNSKSYSDNYSNSNRNRNSNKSGFNKSGFSWRRAYRAWSTSCTTPFELQSKLLTGVIYIIWGTTAGLIKGHARSLDYGSFGVCRQDLLKPGGLNYQAEL